MYITNQYKIDILIFKILFTQKCGVQNIDPTFNMLATKLVCMYETRSLLIHLLFTSCQICIVV